MTCSKIFEARYLKEEGRAPKGKPVELTELTKTSEKLVILGDPGAGKTTLMRYLALQACTGTARWSTKY